MAKNNKKSNDSAVPASTLEAEAKFIPLISKEEEKILQATDIPDSLPILPLRNNVLYPGSVIPIALARKKSVLLVKNAYRNNEPVGVFAQKSQDEESPKASGLYKTGTMAKIIRLLKMPDGSQTAIIQGLRKIEIEEIQSEEPCIQARVKACEDSKETDNTSQTKALLGSIREMFGQLVKLSPKLPQESVFAMQNIESTDFLIYFIATGMELSISEKQSLLEKESLEERAFALLGYMSVQKQVLELKYRIEEKVEADISKQQKEYFLTQQLKTIQEELGGSAEQELQDIIALAKTKKWNEEVRNHFDKEVKKLQRTHSMNPEYSIQLNYLNTLVSLPWNEYTVDNYDQEKARKILDRDHFGLEKVKERILSYLAVLKLRGDMKAPILCLVGPPGVGKTSLGKSIAKAMGRQYVRMSLGGLHDESEVRGHRKTYIGAMPGRVIQGIRKAKSSNPVFMLDEIDKISGMTVQGDPSAALLELLDPEQNSTFHDNFIEVDYDLSRVLFIATANTLSTIHPALLDRMEIIEVPSYVQDEKVEIARKHLIPKQLGEHGMKAKDIVFSDSVIRYIIGEYTRESGVRQLEKALAAVIRERAKNMVASRPELKKKGSRVTQDFVKEALGVPAFTEPEKLKTDMVGVVTGLAWTRTGGDVLFIEAAVSPGKGELRITGNLGNVMQESATLALAYIRTHATSLGIDRKLLEKNNIHIHVPEGATPKDGPSAGITIFTAIVSALTGKKVDCSVAMTGEITLRGQVLPIGGVREKILAAKRAGIKHIVLCKGNLPQVEEIPDMYKTGLEISYIESIADVLPLALL